MGKNGYAIITSMNYFAQTKALICNVRELDSQAAINVLIIDYDVKIFDIYSDAANNIFYYSASKLCIPHFYDMAFKYGIIEFNSSMKPYFLNYLLIQDKYETLIYLDPDIRLFDRLDLVHELLEDHSIVLTPHIISDNYKIDILPYLLHGLFNMGFIALRKDENSLSFLGWWKSKLIDFCRYDVESDLCCDQKWIDFAPVLFSGIYILRHPGYNVAFWNLHERILEKKKGRYYVNGDKLVFYHYSNHKLEHSDYFAYWNEEAKLNYPEAEVIREIFGLYQKAAKLKNFDYYSKIGYGFGCFDNGVLILEEHRKIYDKMKTKISFGNPFEAGNHNSFYQYLIEMER
ncbi:MAG: hypothetical protein FWG91_11645 [Lachnospiraceae bacterium]|nr:hypothetical protein [Lachnospiraceae bacterium]